jgi:hypothetical protein
MSWNGPLILLARGGKLPRFSLRFLKTEIGIIKECE